MDGIRLEDVENELRRPRTPIRFEPQLEAHFEHDTGLTRGRNMVSAGLVAIAIYDIFLFNDYAIRPEAFGEALMLRLGVMTPMALLTIYLVSRGPKALYRESLMAAIVTLAMCVSGAIFFLSSSPHNVFDPFSFGLIILGGNIVFPLRFPYAVASTVANLLVMAGFLWAFPLMGPDVKVFALMVAGATGIFTLWANYRLEATERHSYLLLLRETLRARAAMEDNKALTTISNTDPLTNLANRRQFDEAFALLWNEALGTGRSIGLLVIDIDNFKAYNDRHGHLQGDICLRKVADAMKGELRLGLDLLARFGGEEFVALLPGVDEQAGTVAAERLRQAVEDQAITHCAADGGIVTISVGVAVIPPAAVSTREDLLSMADAALYDAKRNGKNRVELAVAATT
ncbi:MAG TPA: GGDEF domain-containing protein [Noviherbaspirillum sp.]